MAHIYISINRSINIRFNKMIKFGRKNSVKVDSEHRDNREVDDFMLTRSISFSGKKTSDSDFKNIQLGRKKHTKMLEDKYKYGQK